MTRTPILLALVVALALAACADDAEEALEEPADEVTEADEPSDEPDDEPGEPDEAPDEPAEPPEEEQATLALTDTELGPALVDGDGMALYLFTSDEPGESTCYDDCAANWPPLVVDGDPVAGDGVDGDLLGTADRDDGAVQVTYDGWPLYTFAGDAAPGEIDGQGINDVWWLVAPDGEAIENGATGDEEPAQDTGGY